MASGFALRCCPQRCSCFLLFEAHSGAELLCFERLAA